MGTQITAKTMNASRDRTQTEWTDGRRRQTSSLLDIIIQPMKNENTAHQHDALWAEYVALCKKNGIENAPSVSSRRIAPAGRRSVQPLGAHYIAWLTYHSMGWRFTSYPLLYGDEKLARSKVLLQVIANLRDKAADEALREVENEASNQFREDSTQHPEHVAMTNRGSPSLHNSHTMMSSEPRDAADERPRCEVKPPAGEVPAGEVAGATDEGHHSSAFVVESSPKSGTLESQLGPPLEQLGLRECYVVQVLPEGQLYIMMHGEEQQRWENLNYKYDNTTPVKQVVFNRWYIVESDYGNQRIFERAVVRRRQPNGSFIVFFADNGHEELVQPDRIFEIQNYGEVNAVRPQAKKVQIPYLRYPKRCSMPFAFDANEVFLVVPFDISGSVPVVHLISKMTGLPFKIRAPPTAHASQFNRPLGSYKVFSEQRKSCSAQTR